MKHSKSILYATILGLFVLTLVGRVSLSPMPTPDDELRVIALSPMPTPDDELRLSPMPTPDDELRVA